MIFSQFSYYTDKCYSIIMSFNKTVKEMFNITKNLPCKIYGTHCIIKKDRNIGDVRTQEWSFLQNGIP